MQQKSKFCQNGAYNYFALTWWVLIFCKLLMFCPNPEKQAIIGPIYRSSAGADPGMGCCSLDPSLDIQIMQIQLFLGKISYDASTVATYLFI